MSVQSPADEYRLGFIWVLVSCMLLVTIGAWYLGSRNSIPRHELAIFVAWLFAVPVGAIFVRRYNR